MNVLPTFELMESENNASKLIRFEVQDKEYSFALCMRKIDEKAMCDSLFASFFLHFSPSFLQLIIFNCKSTVPL